MPLDSADFLASLDAMLVRVEEAAPLSVMRGAQVIVAKGMARAPVRKGTLRRSIHAQLLSSGGGQATAQVGPATAYARRIELGFMNMTDSLGRLFHQRAKPYFDPAVRESLGQIPEVMAGPISTALGG